MKWVSSWLPFFLLYSLVSLHSNAQMVVNAGSDVLICNGSSAILGGNPTVTGGTPPFAFFWSPSNGLSSANIANPVASPAFTTTYTLTVIGSGADTANDVVRVSVVQPIPVTITGLASNYCFENGPVRLRGIPSGGTFFGPGIISAGTSINSIYTAVPLAIPDNDPAGVVAIQSVASMPGDSLGIDIFLSGIQFSLQHTWIGDLMMRLISPSLDTVLVFDRPGVTTGGFGCSSDDINAFVVTGSGFPVDMENICETTSPSILGSFTGMDDLNDLNNSGPASGLWQLVISDHAGNDLGSLLSWSLRFGTPAVFDPKIAEPDTHTIQYQFSDAYSCSESHSQQVIVRKLIVNAGQDVSICQGDCVALGGNPSFSGGFGGYNFNWTPGPGIGLPDSNWVVCPENTTTYVLNAIDGLGCEGSDTVTVEILPSPLSVFAYVAQGLTTYFSGNAINAVSYQWDFGDGSSASQQNPSHTFSQSGTYEVCMVVTNANGCTDTFCQTIQLWGVGIANEKTGNGISISPNPVKTAMRVSIEKPFSIARYIITDIAGREIMIGSANFAGSISFELNIQESIPEGMYFFTLVLPDRRLTKPFLFIP